MVLLPPEASIPIRDEIKKIYADSENIKPLCKKLYEVYDQEDPDTRLPLFMSYGYKNYSEYVQKELGINPKKAERLRKIYYVLEIDLVNMNDELRAKLWKLQSSKLTLISRVLTLENAEEVFAWAEKTKALDIESGVKKFYKDHNILSTNDKTIDNLNVNFSVIDNRKEEKQKTQRISYYVYPDQKEVIDRAVARAEQLSVSTNENNNLSIIAQSFLATHDFSFREDTKAISNFFKLLEKSLNINLIAFNKEEVLHGKSNIDPLIELLEKENE